MNHTPMKRLSSLAFAGLLCTLAVGCGPAESNPAESSSMEPQPAYEGMPTEESNQVSASAITCPTGWHRHVATWPVVGMYYPGQCSSKAYTIVSGAEVCMRSAAAVVCGGQGYSDVYQPGTQYYYWARTEAFDGH